MCSPNKNNKQLYYTKQTTYKQIQEQYITHLSRANIFGVKNYIQGN